jgi:competence protein ComEA
MPVQSPVSARVRVAGAAALAVLGVAASRVYRTPEARAGPEGATCPALVEVVGRVARPGAVCARTVGEAIDGAGGPVGCRIAAEGRRSIPGGTRVLVGEGEGETCAVRLGEVAGVRRLSLGLRIDLNRAGIADLDALPGIGPRLAQRIIAERARDGPFRRVEELRRVRGIGPKTLARIRPLVTVEAR